MRYTIPKKPYKSIIILDGDKRKECEKFAKIELKYKLKEGGYGEVNVVKPQPEYKDISVFCKFLEELEHFMDNIDKHDDITCPLYCLKEKNIEEYLKPKPRNKKDGPKIAERMETVPKEIEKIFSIILKQVEDKRT